MRRSSAFFAVVGPLALALAGCGSGDDAGGGEGWAGSTSDRYTSGGAGGGVRYHRQVAICFDDYNCFAPFATTTCFSNGACTYEERAPADYRGASARRQAGGEWQIVRASTCDKFCVYLMASSPSNVSRWSLGGNFDVGDACSISLEFC